MDINPDETHVLLQALLFRKNSIIYGNPEGNQPETMPVLNPRQEQLLGEIEHVTTKIQEFANPKLYTVKGIDRASGHDAISVMTDDEDEIQIVEKNNDSSWWHRADMFFEVMGNIEFYTP